MSNVRTFKDAWGDIYGVLAIDVSSAKLAEIMKGIKVKQTGYAMMLHKTGLILADPKHEENELKYVKDIGIENLDTILGADKASFETLIDKKVYQVNSFKSVNTDWIVAVLIEKEELSQVARSIRNMVFGISVLVILVIGFLTAIISGRFIKPINQMVAGQMAFKSNAVATAAEEMSSNISSVAAAVEQSATNISMVSAATEEMTSTIGEIAQNMERTRVTSNQVVARTQKAKELARQTADATLEIKEKIDSAQSATKETVSEIEEITHGIGSVNGMIDTVAAAVEEQSVTTREIATNVTQAAQGIQEVTESMSQSSTVSDEIAKDITDVNQAINDMSGNSSQVDSSAGELSRLSEALQKTVNLFKI